MEKLYETFVGKVAATPTAFVRSLADRIVWRARLIGIRGARGVGKTTLLLQYIKLNLPLDGTVLYVSVDNIWFADHHIYDLAAEFFRKGGRRLFLDEVHRFPNWSQELKNIYDDFPELQVVFTGSSLLEILNANADLSRRAVVYELQGFSFREYLNYNLGLQLPIVPLEDIFERHTQTAAELTRQVQPLKHFSDYLRHGYYPFYNELPELYFQRLGEVVNLIVDIEIPQLRKVDVAFVGKIKQLLSIIARAVPFVPNISKLSERIGISRNALLAYIQALHDSRLTMNVVKPNAGISVLQKPDKIFLENSNLMYALSWNAVEIGAVRETFFANQVRYAHRLNLSPESDFLIDELYTVEVGGREKGRKQIADIPRAFVAADDLEIGYDGKIPLWLFGFLY